MSSPERPSKLYPVAENRPDLLTTGTGRPLADLTVENLASGGLGQADIAISSEALRLQAQVARDAGRARLAENFERGAELVTVPDNVLLEIYELLRPGRAATIEVLQEAAAMLRRDYGAEAVAALVDEAADTYQRRGLFRRRF